MALKGHSHRVPFCRRRRFFSDSAPAPQRSRARDLPRLPASAGDPEKKSPSFFCLVAVCVRTGPTAKRTTPQAAKSLIGQKKTKKKQRSQGKSKQPRMPTHILTPAQIAHDLVSILLCYNCTLFFVALPWAGVPMGDGERERQALRARAKASQARPISTSMWWPSPIMSVRASTTACMVGRRVGLLFQHRAMSTLKSSGVSAGTWGRVPPMMSA